mgnify:FL=1
MPIIQTLVQPKSQDYQENKEAMMALIEDLREKVAHIAQGGSAAATKKHQER